LINPPHQHEKIWRVQEPLNFPITVFGVDRALPGETNMPEITARLSQIYNQHRDDELLWDCTTAAWSTATLAWAVGITHCSHTRMRRSSVKRDENRSEKERRSGNDRRKLQDSNYKGPERRKMTERRIVKGRKKSK
jgi:hypothetical protein